MGVGFEFFPPQLTLNESHLSPLQNVTSQLRKETLTPHFPPNNQLRAVFTGGWSSRVRSVEGQCRCRQGCATLCCAILGCLSLHKRYFAKDTLQKHSGACRPVSECTPGSPSNTTLFSVTSTRCGQLFKRETSWLLSKRMDRSG